MKPIRLLVMLLIGAIITGTVWSLIMKGFCTMVLKMGGVM